MRKRDKFIFYLGGLLTPFIFLIFLILVSILLAYIFIYLSSIIDGFGILFLFLWMIIIFFILPIKGTRFIRNLSHKQITIYKKKGGDISEEGLSKLAFNWLQINLIFGVLGLISAIAIPAFVGIKTYPSASAVKNGLGNGVKECVVRNFDKQTTRFSDAQSFRGNYTQFKIQSLDPNSCYKAKAVPTNDQNTWFKIDLNNETGKVSKTCGDSSKPGCKEGNTW